MNVSCFDLYKMDKENLTSVTWLHAVNSRKLLDEALSSRVMMLEADVIYGKIIGNNSLGDVPIMGHPPAVESDLSLEDFLSEIFGFNQIHDDKKGIKLDFKTIDVFEKSLAILSKIYDQVS